MTSAASSNSQVRLGFHDWKPSVMEGSDMTYDHRAMDNVEDSNNIEDVLVILHLLVTYE